MKRWDVVLYGYYETEVDAETAEEAVVAARDQAAMDASAWDGARADVEEIKYAPLPGTERYHEVATRIRFGDAFPEHRWLTGLGSWWWTNGHVALRCDGPEPTDQTHRIAQPLPVTEEPRAIATWGPVGDVCGIRAHRALGDPRISISADYRALVECGWPDVEWHVSDGQCDVPASVPFLAYWGGELVAIVMGILDREAER